MTYLIGAILILLLIGLVVVFRPPKQKPFEDTDRHDSLADRAEADEDQLDLDIEYGKSKVDEMEEELVLNLDKTDDLGQVESGAHEEEAVLEKTMEKSSAVSEEKGEEIEELDMEFVQEDDHDESAGSIPEIKEVHGSDEFDEDIPFIDEEEATLERKGDMSPALADIPDDFVQPDEVAGPCPEPS